MPPPFERRGKTGLTYVAHPGTAVTGRLALGLRARSSRHATIGQADSPANPPRSSTDPDCGLRHRRSWSRLLWDVARSVAAPGCGDAFFSMKRAGAVRSISEAIKGSTTVHLLRETTVPFFLKDPRADPSEGHLIAPAERPSDHFRRATATEALIRRLALWLGSARSTRSVGTGSEDELCHDPHRHNAGSGSCHVASLRRDGHASGKGRSLDHGNRY